MCAEDENGGMKRGWRQQDYYGKMVKTGEEVYFSDE